MEEIRCKVCGTVVNPGDAFCQNCGSPVEATAPATESTQESAPQNTDVLSGNPYSVGSDASPQASATQSSYQATNTGMNTTTGTYQQPGSSMDSTYGTYGTYGTSSATYSSAPVETPSKAGKVCGIIGLILSIIGLLTSCCSGGLLFGLIGIILCIVCLVKKGSKGLGITGIVIGAIAFIISIIMLVSGMSVLDELSKYVDDDYDYNYDGNDYNFEWDVDYSDNGDGHVGIGNVSSTNQIYIDGDVYTLPASLNSLGMTPDLSYDDTAEKISDIETYGLYPGDYEFVVLNCNNGYTIWGFIENTTGDTVYSLDELQVTGLNVDNYSPQCTASYVEAYGGITLGMSRSSVESALGTPDKETDDGVYYESADGMSYMYLEYDLFDDVECVEVTMY